MKLMKKKLIIQKLLHGPGIIKASNIDYRVINKQY